jgi:hypothetical protein
MTRLQLANRVLQEHKIIDLGEGADPNQLALINAVYEEQYQILFNDSLITWGLSDDIPAEVVKPIVQIVCTNTANIFSGVAFDIELARRELSRIITPDYIPAPTPADYY